MNLMLAILKDQISRNLNEGYMLSNLRKSNDAAP
jgi:hypothetical protein